MTRIDNIDRNIISLLQENGRYSFREIARKLGISEASARRRVTNMRKENVLDIVGVANPLKIGYDTIVIFGIMIEVNRLDDISRQLLELPELRFIGYSSGSFDIIAEAWFRSNQEVAEFLTTKLSKIDGIVRIETSHILRMIKYAYDWGVDHERK